MNNNKKNDNKFFSESTWAAILLIIFGVLTHLFNNDWTTWLTFTFLCVFGLVNYFAGRVK